LVERPPGGYEKEQLADDLLGLLDRLGLERVAYVGHDWGAFAGLLIGIRAPERLSHLVALSIPHLWPSLRDRLNPLRAWALAYQVPLSTPVVGIQLMRRGLTRRVLAAAGDEFSDSDIEVYAATMGSEEGARVTTALYRSFLLKELPAIMLGRYGDARLEVPTQLIVGERDPIVRVSTLSGYEDHAPRMAVERAPGAGHFLPQERDRLIANRLIDGLESGAV
jgi:pimeloyl-ACP methyl ester carboxylesterase